MRSEYGFARGLRRALAGLAVVTLAASPFQAHGADNRADQGGGATPARVTIDLGPAGVLRSFRPDEAIGAAFDGAMKGDIDRQMTPSNIKAMKSADLRPLTYRLRTELGVEAWHWNPVGTWSDPKHQQVLGMGLAVLDHVGIEVGVGLPEGLGIAVVQARVVAVVGVVLGVAAPGERIAPG